MIHECNAQRNTIGKFVDNFRCRACSFTGTLKDAIAHTVENQFTVEYKPKIRKSI